MKVGLKDRNGRQRFKLHSCGDQVVIEPNAKGLENKPQYFSGSVILFGLIERDRNLGARTAWECYVIRRRTLISRNGRAITDQFLVDDGRIPSVSCEKQFATDVLEDTISTSCGNT